MSDLDQSELKLGVHYAHTNDRDFWLFAWNPFDYTCRDKITTISGGTRANHDRRIDVLREPGNGGRNGRAGARNRTNGIIITTSTNTTTLTNTTNTNVDRHRDERDKNTDNIMLTTTNTATNRTIDRTPTTNSTNSSFIILLQPANRTAAGTADGSDARSSSHAFSRRGSSAPKEAPTATG